MAQPDSFTRFGAAVLARLIEKYWHDRGHKIVKAWRVLNDGHETYAVRSNLVDGLPPQ